MRGINIERSAHSIRASDFDRRNEDHAERLRDALRRGAPDGVTETQSDAVFAWASRISVDAALLEMVLDKTFAVGIDQGGKVSLRMPVEGALMLWRGPR